MFANGTHICPRRGIAEYGVFDLTQETRRDAVLVGIRAAIEFFQPGSFGALVVGVGNFVVIRIGASVKAFSARAGWAPVFPVGNAVQVLVRAAACADRAYFMGAKVKYISNAITVGIDFTQEVNQANAKLKVVAVFFL